MSRLRQVVFVVAGNVFLDYSVEIGLWQVAEAVARLHAFNLAV